VPYWRLSGFYAFYFMVVGALVPYFGLYLQSLDFNAKQIGFIASILMLTKIIAPNIWGWLSERSGKRLKLIRLGCLLAVISFAAIFFNQSFLWLAWVITVFTFFWNAVLAQFEVVTLDHLVEQPERYSQIRVWGSLGFVAVVVALGWVFDRIAITYLPHFIFVFTLLIWLSSLSVKEASHREYAPSALGFRQILRKPAVYYFLIASFLLQLSHGPYYTFYSLYLESYDYSRTTIGLLWALGAVAEIAVFLVMHRLMPRLGVGPLFIWSLALTVCRWMLIALFPENLPLMVFAQVLHAFSFGTTHAVAMELVRQHFSGRHLGQGQAIYLSVGFGAGGAVGAVLAGQLWASSPSLTFTLAAVAAALALLAAWLGVRARSS